MAEADARIDSGAPTGSGGNRIRICFIIDKLGRAGTETQLLLLLRSLNMQRVKPYLCLLNGEAVGIRELEHLDIPVLRLNIRKLVSLAACKGAWRLFQYLRSNKIKVLQTYFPDSTLFGAPIGKLARCKVLGARRNIGHWMTNRDRCRATLVNRLVIDMIVANCTAAKNAAVVQETVSAKKIVVIPNGIDPMPFKDIDVWKPSPLAPGRIVGMVGNLRKVKGVDIFIRAASLLHHRYPDVKFIVAGGGNSKKYRAMIEELNLEGCVHLLGSVANIPPLLQTFDVAVLPSRAEGMSGALLEYMAAGRAIVASKVGANEELINNGKNGVLVAAGNEKAVADAVSRYLDDSEFARICALSARKEVFSRYSSEILADRYTRLLQGIVVKEKDE